MRTVHGGGLNPSALRSAAYDDAEVSYLQASRVEGIGFSRIGLQPCSLRMPLQPSGTCGFLSRC